MSADAGTGTVSVDLAERSYEILIGEGLLPEAGRLVGDWLGKRYGASGKVAAVVTDRNVADHASRVTAGLHDAGFTTETVILEPGEKSKSLPVISSIYDRLVEMKADRKTVMVAVGGGVVGDAAGFAAASYARGIPFVQVPTNAAGGCGQLGRRQGGRESHTGEEPHRAPSTSRWGSSSTPPHWPRCRTAITAPGWRRSSNTA